MSPYLQGGECGKSVVALGEVLWDIFDDSRRLGGAALNFAAHAQRLGHDVLLISTVGYDPLGTEAAEAIRKLGLDTRFLQTTRRFPTGTARVRLESGGNTRFVIERPAAYDAIDLSAAEIETIAQRAPDWLYYGTLFAATREGKAVLDRLMRALPGAARFYDLNLRPGCDSPALVAELLARANAVKLNGEELHAVHEFAGLPLELEAFCREGAAGTAGPPCV